MPKQQTIKQNKYESHFHAPHTLGADVCKYTNIYANIVTTKNEMPPSKTSTFKKKMFTNNSEYLQCVLKKNMLNYCRQEL